MTTFLITILLGVGFAVFGKTFGRGVAFVYLKVKNFLNRGVLNILDDVPVYPTLRFLFSDFTAVTKAPFFPEFKWLDLDRYVRIKFIAIVFTLLIFAVIIFTDLSVFVNAFLLVICFMALTFPDLRIKSSYKKRITYLAKTLSGIVDNMSLLVSCGVNIEQTIDKIKKTRNDMWKDMFETASYFNRGGLPMYLSLEKSAAISGSGEFLHITSIIKQSIAFGTPLTEVLKTQAEIIRMKRKSKAEERAKTASVRIILPLVLCIFPALLLVFLAPAIIKVSIDL